jgi:large subunit ribosomal protein L35Ae
MVSARVIQFRRGRKTFTPKHFLIEISGSDSREKAKKFIGKEVSWTSTGKEATIIKGKIAAAHGNNGVVRAIFEKGLPGQSIGTEVKLI